MAVTKGKYQTQAPTPDTDLHIWFVMDTEADVTMACCTSDKLATHVANALNFSHKPSEYGYRLNTEKDAGR